METKISYTPKNNAEFLKIIKKCLKHNIPFEVWWGDFITEVDTPEEYEFKKKILGDSVVNEFNLF